MKTCIFITLVQRLKKCTQLETVTIEIVFSLLTRDVCAIVRILGGRRITAIVLGALIESDLFLLTFLELSVQPHTPADAFKSGFIINLHHRTLSMYSAIIYLKKENAENGKDGNLRFISRSSALFTNLFNYTANTRQAIKPVISNLTLTQKIKNRYIYSYISISTYDKPQCHFLEI